MIPKHLSKLHWPAPPVPTKNWGSASWARYVLSSCLCPACGEAPSYSNPRAVAEPEPGLHPPVMEACCTNCDHVWGRPPRSQP